MEEVLDIVQPFIDLATPATEVGRAPGCRDAGSGAPALKPQAAGQALPPAALPTAHRPRLVAAPATQAEARAPSAERRRGLSVCRNALSLLGALSMGTFHDASGACG